MLNPYHVIGQALALFKAAGLPVPAYGEEEKRRLLDAWVQRYGDVDNEVFAACSSKLASGQRFPRFYDMDEAVKEEQLIQKDLAIARSFCMHNFLKNLQSKAGNC